ncbi:MAG: hypothetical protein ACLGPL_07310 [Acidobacteriota bacterium]
MDIKMKRKPGEWRIDADVLKDSADICEVGDEKGAGTYGHPYLTPSEARCAVEEGWHALSMYSVP